MASSEYGKTAANQRDHSHHCIPSTARAVTPLKVGVISAMVCMSQYFVNVSESNALTLHGGGWLYDPASAPCSEIKGMWAEFRNGNNGSAGLM